MFIVCHTNISSSGTRYLRYLTYYLIVEFNPLNAIKQPLYMENEKTEQRI